MAPFKKRGHGWWKGKKGGKNRQTESVTTIDQNLATENRANSKRTPPEVQCTCSPPTSEKKESSDIQANISTAVIDRKMIPKKRRGNKWSSKKSKKLPATTESKKNDSDATVAAHRIESTSLPINMVVEHRSRENFLHAEVLPITTPDNSIKRGQKRKNTHLTLHRPKKDKLQSSARSIYSDKTPLNSRHITETTQPVTDLSQTDVDITKVSTIVPELIDTVTDEIKTRLASDESIQQLAKTGTDSNQDANTSGTHREREHGSNYNEIAMAMEEDDINNMLANLDVEKLIQEHAIDNLIHDTVNVPRRHRGSLYMAAAGHFTDTYTLGQFQYRCIHCTALHFLCERTTRNVYTGCCKDGTVLLPPYQTYPQELAALYDNKHFMEKIRYYNNSFAFASLGAHIVNPPGQGPYVFKVQGEIRHQISNVAADLCDEQRLYGNLYFLDTELANQMRSSGPQAKEQLNQQIVQIISNYLLAHNPLAQAYRFLREVYQQQQQEGQQQPEVDLYINNDRAHDINFRQYGAVQCNEIAGVFVSKDGQPPLNRCLRVLCRRTGQSLHIVSYLSVNCDALTYPLLHPRGEEGWQANTPHRHGKGYISLLEYYSYRIAPRPNVFNPFIMAGKLTQQFIVDGYLKVEQNRLEYLRNNQGQIKQEVYQRLIDYLNADQLDTTYQPGNIFILPSTFIGGPRAFRQNYLDAMSIVTKYGKPDIFLTFTCNPTWSEIKDNLYPNQHSSNRPDLVSRVFKCKLKELVEDIDKRHILGVCVAYVYVIEFQKRGLPHAHMLLWMEGPDKILDASSIDRLISAEFPDLSTHPELHNLVKTHMLHGPCTEARCLDGQGNCSKQFPKALRDDTLYNTNGYPLYRRREMQTAVQIGKRTVDNGWVVPYNPYLLQKYQGHLNIEGCSSIRSVKYLFKYIYKGYDRAKVVIQTTTSEDQATTTTDKQAQAYDEIKMFLDVRYVSAPEAMWRLHKYEMHSMTHAIIRLDVHLPNRQQVYFKTNSELCDVVERATTQHTTLTGWFALNAQDTEARQYTYVQIPYNYVWKKTKERRFWSKRQQHFDRIIPRLYFVHPREGERFYLRQILLHKTGCRSFEDLRTVHGHTYDTFRDAAIAMNLLTDDRIWFSTLREAAKVELPRALRRMFSQMLLFCEIEKPQALWDEFKYHLSEDYIRRFNHNDVELAYDCALAYINRYLAQQGKSNDDFQLPEPTRPVDRLIETENETDPQEDEAIAKNNIPLLNTEQRRIFHDVIAAINETGTVSHRLFFINGVGGAGKTFLLNTLLAYLSGNSYRYLAMCYTGIAASLLKNGRTIHSAFMLPVPFVEDSTSKLKNMSKIADNIRNSIIIVIDEISMVHKHIFNEIDRKLKELMNNNLLFGGKIILAVGDFRQTAPIVRLGGKFETISASVKCSEHWRHFVQYDLITNLRALPQEVEFKNWLMAIGDNSNPMCHLNNGKDSIVQIPNNIIVDNIIESVYGKANLSKDDFSLLRKAILCPLNVDVKEINSVVLEKLPSRSKQYLSVDSIIREDDTVDNTADDLDAAWPQDFLNSLDAPGIPPHILTLKVGAVIILTKNLDVKRGLCNGTRLLIHKLHEHIIEAKRLEGSSNQTEIELIPRVDNIAINSLDLPVNLKRRQFPVRLAFAMTINKSQGQTLDTVGLYLPVTVFDHGQLYVALSRARSFENLKIFMANICGRQYTANKVNEKSYTINVVYNELLQSSAITLNSSQKTCVNVQPSVVTRLPPKDKIELQLQSLGDDLRNIEITSKHNKTHESKVQTIEDSSTRIKIDNNDYTYKLNECHKTEVLSYREYLTDTTINRFGELLNRFSRTEHVINVHEFNHQDVLLCQTPQYIRDVPYDQPNIQILFGQNKDSDVGHWLTVYYDTKFIHIYDSLNSQKLSYDSVKQYIDKLHPYSPKIIYHQVQQQPDSIICGVFAIAFAVSIYFGDCPEDVTYDVSLMKKHLWKMFLLQKLIRFPIT